MITYSPFSFVSDPGSIPTTFADSTFSRFTAIFARSFLRAWAAYPSSI